MNYTTITRGVIDDSESYLTVNKDIEVLSQLNEIPKDNVWVLNSMFNAVDLGVLLLDSMGCIKTFNFTADKQCTRFLGEELKENRAFADYLSAEMKQVWLDKFSRAIKGEQVHKEFVFRLRPRKEFWFGMSFSPLGNNSAPAEGVCVIITDNTERKRASNKFRSQFIEIENNNRELDKFVKVLSHDLRAPLSSVSGLISLAREEKNPLEFENYLNMMENSIQKLEVFTNEMIASLKNRNAFVLGELNHHDLVDEIIDELRFAADAEGIRFENLIPEDCIALSDPARLRIIFSNLISNAIRYHDPEKTEKHIVIRCDKTALSVSFSVEDNGLGIADEHQSNIFETYYTIGNVAGSSGLGLSNVRDAVQKLRGKIELKSKQGQGSVFTIILPIN